MKTTELWMVKSESEIRSGPFIAQCCQEYASQLSFVVRAAKSKPEDSGSDRRLALSIGYLRAWDRFTFLSDPIRAGGQPLLPTATSVDNIDE